MDSRCGAGRGWFTELLQCASEERSKDDGKVSNFCVPPDVLARILDEAFQSVVFLEAVTSSFPAHFIYQENCDKSDSPEVLVKRMVMYYIML